LNKNYNAITAQLVHLKLKNEKERKNR